MVAKIILSSEPSSAKFNDRVLLFEQVVDGLNRVDREEVRVTRSSTEENPDTYNAVFECRVISKPHAVISLNNGQFFLQDLGSRNGSFINNFCLRVNKEETPIYSQDILRFGSEVMIGNYSGKAKCIIARIRIYMSDGTEFAERPVNDKFFRAKEETISQGNSKRVSFVDEEFSIEEKVDKLEKIITHTFENGQEMMYGTIAMLENKLERKEIENQTLMKNIANIYEEELHKLSKDNFKDGLECLIGESDKSSVEHSEELKHYIQDTGVTKLEKELKETKHALRLSNGESSLLKEKLRAKEKQNDEEEKDAKKEFSSETEKNRKKEPEEESVTHVQMKILFEDGWEKIESQNVEVKKNDNLEKISENKFRERKLTALTSSAEPGLKINNEDYVNIKPLTNNGNKFSVKYNAENAHFLKIIAEDQKAIKEKDDTICELENSLQEKIGEYEKLMEANKEKYHEEYNSILLDEISKIAVKHNAKVDTLQNEIERLNKKERELKTSLEKHHEMIAKYEALKIQLSESEMIIEQKNKEIDNQMSISKNNMNLKFTMNILNKENTDLKISNWQKDSDIVKLKESNKKKDYNISKSNDEIDKYRVEVRHLEGENVANKRDFTKMLMDKEKVINNMKDIIKEAEAEMRNSTSELSLKIESFDHLESNGRLNSNMEIVKQKDKDDRQQCIIVDETENEEESISDGSSSSITTEETLDCNEKGTNLDSSERETVDMLSEYMPPRPPRMKTKTKTADAREKADCMIVEDHVEDESDTITFHDALNEEFGHDLSDEEDVSIEDLELDEESDNTEHRKSDIYIEGSGSQKNLRILANRFLSTKILKKVLDVKKS